MKARNYEDHGVYGFVGHAIAQRRTAVALSQSALGEAVGLTRTSISNIENGRQKLLVHTLLDIAKTLNTDPSSLLPKPKEMELTASLDFSSDDIPKSLKERIAAVIRDATIPERAR